MRNIKLIIEYDGTGYHGWQSQINALTIQDVVQDAIKKLTGEEVSLIGSSRTDFGVHALGQVANFLTESKIPAEKFSFALNSLLPDDIVIKCSQQVPLDFHSRFCAKGKKYKYLIFNSSHPSAIFRNRAWNVFIPLKLDLMKSASEYIIGEHDFSSFRASGSSIKSSIRNITNISLSRDAEIITLEIEGNGFLYNMVRIITGTLVSVGSGKIAPDEMKVILESRDRTKAGPTAPAQGLFLVHVNY